MFRLTTICLLSVTVIPLQAGDKLLAGAALCDITPPVGTPMWGYAVRHDAPSTAVRDRLQARAVVLTAGETKVAIVSLDLGRPPTRNSSAAIREKLRADGVTDVLLVASHTHHGPILELETPYVRSLEDRLVELIRAADLAKRPARWGVANEETAFNRNRQSKLAGAPVDRTLTVMRFEGVDGKPVAHLVHFAAHPTMLPSSLMQFSADYPGSLAAAIEKATDAPCLFLQGAAGDLSPNPPKGVTGPDAFGGQLAETALKLARTISCPDVPATELSVRTETFAFAARLDVSNALIRAALARVFFPELVAFYEREYRDGVRPQSTVMLLDGKLGIVGMSGEMFCGHALSLRKRARLETVLLCGYCNDYQQYFPTIEAAAEGGFGTTPPIGMAEIGAGEKMIDRALITLFHMRGLLPGM